MLKLNPHLQILHGPLDTLQLSTSHGQTTHGAITTALGPCYPATHRSPLAELQGCCWVSSASLSPWHPTISPSLQVSTAHLQLLQGWVVLFLFLLSRGFLLCSSASDSFQTLQL
ncbi:hypothetical protein SLEP1_g44284 [Rubroshorea leprosula]|uniref:Uncharacterized protein n=1 Tax=Rubroshorea leprosula TaxID=152421 RepID=A0AAV5LGZ2_9ROSI|nr:hypothetical protein SLEP1_g44284 [Rubroshorea leprosula]